MRLTARLTSIEIRSRRQIPLHSVQLRTTTGYLSSANRILAVVHVRLRRRKHRSKAGGVEDSAVVRDLGDIASVDNAILEDQDRDVRVFGESGCGDQASETPAHDHVVVGLCGDGVGGCEGRKGSQCCRGAHLEWSSGMGIVRRTGKCRPEVS